MKSELQKVDHSALRVNQSFIIGLLLAAFVLNIIWLVGLVALAMLIGTAVGRPGFKWAYAGLKSLHVVKPEVILDNPQPHVFAQGMGGSVLVLAMGAFWFGSTLVGWALVWLVIVLAALNLFLGFCAGCFVYYWLSRWRVPGFSASPLPGTFPGMKPRR